MSKIQRVFSDLKQEGKKGLITYITGGFPSLERTRDTILRMADGGADIIEIGIPFSDPVADGPVIQAASQQALENGTRISDLIEVVAQVRKESQVPILFMTYYNPVLQFGLDRFCRQSADTGVDGLIIPDLPFEESSPLQNLADQYGLDLIPLVAPTTPADRVGLICSQARGFVYCISVTGVTGGQTEITTNLAGLSDKVRTASSLPVAIGFGVSDPKTARKVAPYADAVVVGSALVRLMAEERFSEIEDLVREIKQGMR
ncbi:MAG: tryptophan synthase subunit alpha [Chitinophagales bacterium]